MSEDASGKRIDRALTDWVGPPTSRATVQRWIAEGRVTVDGRVARAKDVVHAGQAVGFQPGSVPSSRAEPDASVPIDVVWEDEHLIVVNKPAGLVVHPARGHATGTLVNGLLALSSFGRPHSDARDPQGLLRPGIVHRIDKGTSGLLVVAKTELAREGLKDQFARHTIERRYWAVTVGSPTAEHIDTGYGRHPTARLKFTSRITSERRAVTHVQIVEQFPTCTVVHCRLETGRTHQIRVHLCEQAGSPLLGDPLYSGGPVPPALAPLAQALGRQALHARTLGFVHPATQQQLHFEATLPADLEQLIAALRLRR